MNIHVSRLRRFLTRKLKIRAGGTLARSSNPKSEIENPQYALVALGVRLVYMPSCANPS